MLLAFETPTGTVPKKGTLVMQIQINTDDNVVGGDGLSDRISAEIHTCLDRFSQHITRIEVHLSDENSHKSLPDRSPAGGP